MKKKIFMAAVLAGALTALSAQETILLYDKVPDSKPGRKKETAATQEGILRISHVAVPDITVYKPAKPVKNGAAVIICPGGGYGILAAAHEGSDVAKLFTEWGITAFVLKYRLPDDSIMVKKELGPLQDAQRAIQLIRQRAAEWNIAADKIGIMGFSAGGHLAATASTWFDKAVIGNIAGVSLRPDFSILIYPVISFADSITHMGSRNALLGKEPAADKILAYSADRQVSKKTPPAFLVHASDDKSVKVGHSISYYQALQAKSIPAELHVYQGGGHGFGMNNKTTADQWTGRLKEWLRSNKLID